MHCTVILSRITGTTVIEGERNDDFSSISTKWSESSSNTDRMSCFSAHRTTRPASSIRKHRSGGCSNSRRRTVACSASTRPTGSSPTSLPSRCSATTFRVVSRTYSKTWAMAAVRLGYLLAPSWIIDELEKVVLPYHLDAMTQIAGEVALDHLDAMNDRVARLVDERGS